MQGTIEFASFMALVWAFIIGWAVVSVGRAAVWHRRWCQRQLEAKTNPGPAAGPAPAPAPMPGR